MIPLHCCRIVEIRDLFLSQLCKSVRVDETDLICITPITGMTLYTATQILKISNIQLFSE